MQAKKRFALPETNENKIKMSDLMASHKTIFQDKEKVQ